jgi:hypothetical protein
MEALYESLLTLEVALVNAAVSGAGYFCEYTETVTDEDRVEGYKLMALRLVVEG